MTFDFLTFDFLGMNYRKILLLIKCMQYTANRMHITT